MLIENLGENSFVKFNYTSFSENIIIDKILKDEDTISGVISIINTGKI